MINSCAIPRVAVVLGAVALVAATSACSGDAGGSADDDLVTVEATTSIGRLFVRVSAETADGTEQTTEVIDLDDGSGVVTLSSGARIHADGRGQFGVLDESWGDGRLRFVDPGVELVDGAISKRDPSILSFEVASADVLNVDVQEGAVGVFSETGSVARFIDTTPLPSGQPNVVVIDSNDGLSMIDEEGMGGQALPWGDEFLVSIVSEGDPPFPAGPMPVGVRRFDAGGEPLEEYPCSGLGFAAAGDLAVLACSDGLLVLERNGDGVVVDRVAYPSETAACFQVLGRSDVPAFIVLCSDANTFEFLDLYRFSVAERELSVIEGTAGRWTPHLVGSGSNARIAYVERATGDVVIVSLAEGVEIGRSERVVEPFPAFPVSWSTVSGERMYVGFVAANADDPEVGDAVVEVSLSGDVPVVERRFPVDGTPGRIEVLGAVS